MATPVAQLGSRIPNSGLYSSKALARWYIWNPYWNDYDRSGTGYATKREAEAAWERLFGIEAQRRWLREHTYVEDQS